MSKPPVLLTTKVPSSVLGTLEAACAVDYNDAGSLPHDALVEKVRGKKGLICVFTDAVSRDVLDAGRDLQVVSTIAVGYNNIDVDAARERGIVVTNTPDVVTEATADLTWALIMDITRRVSEGDRLVRRGGWKGWTFDFMLGTELRGKQLGIIGYGRIGRAVAARAVAFGMRVVFTGRHPSADPMARPLDRLLASSDVVSIHCPLTPDTRHLINQASLARMKRSAYLVNASRGPVVDEAALAWALKNRIISGAALDVYEDEPKVYPELLSLENVVLVPHLGSATTETRTAMADLAVRNAIAVLTGQPALTSV
jgi:glyoxylate reductase